MATQVLMPRLTYEMETGVVVRWLKSEGDTVEASEPLFEVETDKAIIVVEATASGILVGIRAEAGQAVAVGQAIAFILAPGEALPDLPPLALQAAEGDRTTTLGYESALLPVTAASPEPGPRPATPIAKRIAREHRLDLSAISGSGPSGRITEADVLREIERRTATQVEGEPGYRLVRLSRMRHLTGERLSEAQARIPCFVLEVGIDMQAAAALRKASDPHGHQVSYTTILVKAVAMALVEHPQVNACFYEGQLKVWDRINIGVAMAAADGLLVPVIRRANEKTLREIDHALQELRRVAKQGALQAQDLAGSTFTVSNLGMYGIDAFQAFINPPQAAILATGRIRELAVGINGGIVLRPQMNARLTVDHRALDGATAALFLTRLKELVEQAQFPQ